MATFQILGISSVRFFVQQQKNTLDWSGVD